jgi:hypothetical protein
MLKPQNGGGEERRRPGRTGGLGCAFFGAIPSIFTGLSLSSRATRRQPHAEYLPLKKLEYTSFTDPKRAVF